MRRYIKASQVFKGLGSMLIYLCEHTHILSVPLSRARLYTPLRTSEQMNLHRYIICAAHGNAHEHFVWSGKTLRQRHSHTLTHIHAANHTDFIFRFEAEEHRVCRWLIAGIIGCVSSSFRISHMIVASLLASVGSFELLIACTRAKWSFARKWLLCCVCVCACVRRVNDDKRRIFTWRDLISS